MTDDRRLDELLAQGLEPEPADEGFTEKVMTVVRKGNGRLRPLGLRRFTRPALLAAAAVLIAGGALAAVRTVVPERKEAAPPPPASAPVVQTLPAQTPAKPVTAQPASDESSKSRPTPTPGPFRRGDTEYGYTSPHTAYAKDSSLRLEAETYDNAMKVGEPERVTVSLENLTDRPIMIYAPRGCPFTVAAYHGSREMAAKDPSSAKVWNCAGSGGDPRTSQKEEPEMFVLEPHAKRTEQAMVVLGEPGEWHIVSQCICYERRAAQASPYPTARPTPTPTGRPVVDPVLRPSETEKPPTVERREPTTRDGYDGSRQLFTPPIRITAR